MTDFAYNSWPSRAGEWEGGPVRGASEWDNIDFHVDLGCGLLPKARIGVDRFPAPCVDVVVDLERGELPFETSSIKSIISHHAFEHIGAGFIPLVDEIYRVLEPGGILRAITPLFPSWSAVADPDHRRYFMAEPDGPSTWDVFCGTPGDGPSNCWLASFSVPYTSARFEKVDQDLTPPVPVHDQWTSRDARELRVALRAVK